MTVVSVELETLISERDALTTRPPPECERFFCSNHLIKASKDWRTLKIDVVKFLDLYEISCSV